MGRSHRGSSGRGGGGRHRGARPAQPTAAPPSGDALRVELRASPEFFMALEGRDCPATAAEGSSSTGASPMGTCMLQLEHWKDLDRLLAWFRDGIAADPQAELAFSSRLTKSQRASVHGTATAVGLGGLGTASRGVGEGRCVVVLSKQRAVRPELSEKQDHQAFWTWRWAGQRGLQVSRDEVAEMILGGGLTPELQAIWDEQSALQKAVQQLCGAVVAGDAASVAAALDANPGLLQDRVFDVQTGVAPLHLAAREGRPELVELLLGRGAAVDGVDGHGWTPLQVARKYEQSDAEGVLLRAGARDPDKGKSILDLPAAAPGNGPAVQAAAPGQLLANGTKPAAAALASRASQSDGGSQDAYIDSTASVCGTERDNLAAEVGSNAEDYADPQYQAPSGSLPPPAIEEGEEGGDAEATAESACAQAEAVALAAEAAAEAEVAAAEAAAEEAAAAELAATAEASPVPRAVPALAASEVDDDEAEEEEEKEYDDDSGLSVDEEEVMAEEVADRAKLSAVRAFSAALAAAEAAEAAAEAAESMPGEEAAQRASAFRLEAEAAVAAAAAAAVVVGEALDDVLTPANSRTLPPPPPPSSAASICGSDATARSALPDAAEFWATALSSEGSAPAPAPSAQSAAGSQLHEEAQDEAAAPQHAAAAAGEAALAGGAGAAAAATAAAAAGQSEAAPQAPAKAAEAAADDVHSAAAAATEHAKGAAKGAAAAASWASSRERAELEARAPEWGQWVEQKAPEVMQWVQEHPGSVMAGAGIVAAALAALLLGARRR